MSKVFNYEMTSDSGNIADPNNVIYPTQVFIPANSSIALDGSILDVSAISTNENDLYINPSSLSDFIYLKDEENEWPIVEWSGETIS